MKSIKDIFIDYRTREEIIKQTESQLGVETEMKTKSQQNQIIVLSNALGENAEIIKKLTQKNQELIKQNQELIKQNKELIKQNKELKKIQSDHEKQIEGLHATINAMREEHQKQIKLMQEQIDTLNNRLAKCTCGAK